MIDCSGTVLVISCRTSFDDGGAEKRFASVETREAERVGGLYDSV